MDRSELAREWAGALAQVIYIARPRYAVERELVIALDELIDALLAKQFTDEPVAKVADRLVRLGLRTSDCMHCTINMLGERMPQLPELACVENVAGRLVPVFGELARSLSENIRHRLLSEQEGLTRALISSRENTERALRDSEAKFEEIFSTSSVGMAISDLEFKLIRSNRALGQILEHRRGKLDVDRLDELFHPDEAGYLRLRYQVLLEEDSLPFRERHRLVRSDGEEALVFLSASVLRASDGTPRYYVTSAEDVSDKHFLEGQLQFQATHDALTGLANRPRFIGRLEEALGGRHPADEITVLHLDLDGFHAINDGLGREVGDRLLQVVATRLREVFADERATIARLDADEFGILVEHSPVTPSVTSIATRINDELAEPVFVGEHGVAATATVAVLHRPPATMSPAELLRATDITLRRLKSGGRRQWGMVDEQQNELDRQRFNLASSMPGAWESGEIELDYQPLVAAEPNPADRGVVAVQALLRWDRPDGQLDHGQCLDALAETGLSLPIGRWLLARACEQLKMWSDRLNGEPPPKLYVELTKDLAGDPDLVATVQAVLADACLSAEQLLLGMPVQALCMVDGLAEDNLDVLVDLGCSVVLYEFGTTRGDLACLEDLSVHAVKMASRVVHRVARGVTGTETDGSLFTRAIRDLVPLVAESGTPVIVGDIDTEEQFEWWRAIGASTVQGRLTGAAGPPQHAEDLFVA